MTEVTILQFVRDVGFPAAIATIMLYFFMKSWSAYGEQVENLTRILHEQNAKILEQNKNIMRLLERQEALLGQITQSVRGDDIMRLLEENRRTLERMERDYGSSTHKD